MWSRHQGCADAVSALLARGGATAYEVIEAEAKAMGRALARYREGLAADLAKYEALRAKAIEAENAEIERRNTGE